MNAATAPQSESNRCQVRAALKRSLHKRHASLTPIEKTFLSALLIDSPSGSASKDDEEEEHHKRKIENAIAILDDDILFSLPFRSKSSKSISNRSMGGDGGITDEENNAIDEATDEETEEYDRPPLPPKPQRSNVAQLDLWKAYNDGVRPTLLKAISERGISKGCILQADSDDPDIDGEVYKKHSPRRRCSSRKVNSLQRTSTKSLGQSDQGERGISNSSLDVQSDHEVGSINEDSSASSWNSSQGGFDHYNAWEVIRDEYAEDFGFKVATDDENKILPYNSESDEENNDGSSNREMFKILGTSAEDTQSLPHVLSPPLMDSLFNFLPDHLSQNNFWLKFSLVRDGASLDILKRYCRAATHTVLAIETTNGEVFGAFTSAPWHLNNKYFGTGEAFLWRMRHSRNTPVHSLFEQAKLESEIDMFPYNGSNDYIQLCTHDKLALGGGNTLLLKEDSAVIEGEPLDAPVVLLEDGIYGFGLALDENLLHGTTSPSATFGNANLLNNSDSGETFDVLNLEVWGFTSLGTEKSAQKSEMSMFFVRESISSNLSSRNNSRQSSIFSGDDLSSQEQFYRRLGAHDDNESDRDAWSYSNMMNPVAGSPYRSVSGYGRS